MRTVSLRLGDQGQSAELKLYCVWEIISWKGAFWDITTVTELDTVKLQYNVIPGWTDKMLNFFWNGLPKLEQWDKKCIEFRGGYVE
jgi:hypothetical protein